MLESTGVMGVAGALGGFGNENMKCSPSHEWHIPIRCCVLPRVSSLKYNISIPILSSWIESISWIATNMELNCCQQMFIPIWEVNTLRYPGSLLCLAIPVTTTGWGYMLGDVHECKYIENIQCRGACWHWALRRILSKDARASRVAFFSSLSSKMLWSPDTNVRCLLLSTVSFLHVVSSGPRQFDGLQSWSWKRRDSGGRCWRTKGNSFPSPYFFFIRLFYFFPRNENGDVQNTATSSVLTSPP